MRQERERGAEAPRGPRSVPQPEYWAKIYEDYHEELRHYFAKYVKSSQDVDDLVQSVFVKLIAHNCTLQYPRVYVHVAARHVMCSFWQRKKRNELARRATSTSCDGRDVNSAARGDLESDPLRQAAKGETRVIVVSTMAGLSPILAEALRLRFMNELHLEEAAAQAGCSRETLKKRLRRAKQFLVKWLGGGAGCLD